MLNKSIFHLAFVVLLAISGNAKAANIEKSLDSHGNSLVLLQGKITPGDTQKLAQFFLNTRSYPALNLDSRGGDVVEAIRLGELVRALRLQVQVADGGMCASACFFVWINGAYRVAVSREYKNGSGSVGLHRPFLINPENQESSLQKQSKVIAGVRDYLDSNFIPRRLIDIMMSRPSNDVYWLTEDDFDELGATPPALEELYISKCGANTRQLTTQKIEAKRARDSAAEAKVDAQLRKIFQCTNDLDLDAHLVGIRKLTTGWLPPVPFRDIK